VKPANTLILGIGNVLMGDEGVGVYAVQALAREDWPEHVTVIDGGTGGFQLLELINGHSPIVIIDATMDGQPAGTVSVLRPRYATDFPRALTAHDIGLRDLIETAAMLRPLPPITLVTVSIEQIDAMNTRLSPAVQAAIPVVFAVVRMMVMKGVPAHA
jgi:hydrogenase maturation protease